MAEGHLDIDSHSVPPASNERRILHGMEKVSLEIRHIGTFSGSQKTIIIMLFRDVKLDCVQDKDTMIKKRGKDTNKREPYYHQIHFPDCSVHNFLLSIVKVRKESQPQAKDQNKCAVRYASDSEAYRTTHLFVKVL